jgi:hypothetical protein
VRYKKENERGGKGKKEKSKDDESGRERDENSFLNKRRQNWFVFDSKQNKL